MIHQATSAVMQAISWSSCLHSPFHCFALMFNLVYQTLFFAASCQHCPLHRPPFSSENESDVCFVFQTPLTLDHLFAVRHLATTEVCQRTLRTQPFQFICDEAWIEEFEPMSFTDFAVFRPSWRPYWMECLLSIAHIWESRQKHSRHNFIVESSSIDWSTHSRFLSIFFSVNS